MRARLRPTASPLRPVHKLRVCFRISTYSRPSGGSAEVPSFPQLYSLTLHVLRFACCCRSIRSSFCAASASAAAARSNLFAGFPLRYRGRLGLNRVRGFRSLRLSSSRSTAPLESVSIASKKAPHSAVSSCCGTSSNSSAWTNSAIVKTLLPSWSIELNICAILEPSSAIMSSKSSRSFSRRRRTVGSEEEVPPASELSAPGSLRNELLPLLKFLP
mmetsp:Transcript_30749/g.67338  ORF Transcript_30749/g.67338 Transcript_30749/m.67338 type:complete len:216 (+) Transcript_30749:388-1035(+)